MMQATLLTEDGTVLGRKFLKISEDVRSGSSFQLPNLLVEVGEPRKNPAGNRHLGLSNSTLHLNGITAAKYTTREWHDLYTNQITQKASGGSFQLQATLLTEDGTVLGRKFLKLSEDVRSGSSFQLPNYLVAEARESPEGEPPKSSFTEKYEKPTFRLTVYNHERGKRDPVDQPLHGGDTLKSALSGRKVRSMLHPSFRYEPGKSDSVDNPLHGGNRHLASSNSSPHLNGITAAKYTTKEWHALYTNQITQKAKKYRSGFLTVASCGSFKLQATFLTEDGTVLGRKFLKLSEDVRSGSSFQLPDYLCPAGEPPKPSFTEKDEKPTFHPSVYNSEREKSDPVDQPLHGGETPKSALSGKKVKSTLHPSFRYEPGKSDSIDNPLLSGEPAKDALCRRGLKSTFHPIIDSTEPGKSGTVDKPLRGAKDILSILRNSTNKQNSLPAKSVSLEQHDRSQSSDYGHSQSRIHTEKDVRHGTDNDTMGVLNSGSKFRGESPCIYSSPSSFFIGEEIDDFSVLNTYEELTSKSILKPLCSAKYPQVKQEPQEPLPLENLSNGCNEAFI